MKKIIVLILSLSLILSGCSSTTNDKKEEKKDKSVQEEKKEEKKEIKKEKKETEKVKEEKKDAENAKFNKNLTGKELLKDYFAKNREDHYNRSYRATVYMKTKDREYKFKVIKNKKDAYFEDVEGGNKIVFVNSKDGYIYSYKKGEKEGIKYKSYGIYDAILVGLDLGREEGGTKKDEFANVLNASIKEYNGEEVLYMELSGSNTEGARYLTKVWYSISKRLLIKRSMEIDGKFFSEEKITDIEVDKDFSDLVKVPNDIKFAEE